MSSQTERERRRQKLKRNFMAKELRNNPLYKQQKIQSKRKKQEVSKFREQEYEEELQSFKKGELE